MDWTLLPAPDPKASTSEINVSMREWKRFLISLTGKSDMLGAIDAASNTGCFESIEVNYDGLDYNVCLDLTSKGIREASEAHQKKDRVSIHTHLPESLRGLSVEELSERVLESPKDYADFNSAISTAKIASTTPVFPVSSKEPFPIEPIKPRDHVHFYW